MKKLLRSLSIVLAVSSLSACSISPGIPGLKLNSSQSIPDQVEGVDYKVVVIDANVIKNQRPFDYVAFVKNKKQKSSLFKSQTRSKQVKSYHSAGNTKGSKQGGGQGSKAVNRASSFPGISSGDNKANYQYFLGKGDVLNITVWDHPELTEPSANNGGHLIDNEGRFYFPYSGKINAEGKTVGSIRNELQRKLKSFITKPQVSVSVAGYRSQKVYTSGAVRNPTTLMVNDTPITVRDAISNSGGLIFNQYTGFATLARNNKNINIDLNRLLKFNDNRQNFILKNGDRLHIVERNELAEFKRELDLTIQRENALGAVRLENDIKKERAITLLEKDLEGELKSEQAKVFVMGEIEDAGTVTFQAENGITLAEAINEAGSFKEDSVNPNGVFVIRKANGVDKIPTVYQLPIASVQSIFYAEEFDLRPRDIVYVTSTPSVRWNRLLGQLLPSLAVLNTFRNFTN